jgi:hypothetical protein
VRQVSCALIEEPASCIEINHRHRAIASRGDRNEFVMDTTHLTLRPLLFLARCSPVGTCCLCLSRNQRNRNFHASICHHIARELQMCPILLFVYRNVAVKGHSGNYKLITRTALMELRQFCTILMHTCVHAGQVGVISSAG